MQTNFTLDQLEDPAIREADGILRSCVHCGFCTATCPTFVLIGDERDSPRGRIYLIKDMLEKGRAATREDVTHLDRCLSCLACMTTCPSGVHYMHLVDHARAHVEATYRRPFADRLIRSLLARILPYPARFGAALRLARLARPVGAPVLRRLAGRPAPSRVGNENRPMTAGLPSAVNTPRRTAPNASLLSRLEAMLALAPASLPAAPAEEPATITTPAMRVAMLTGCAQSVLAPSINAAARRVLARAGVAVVPAPGEGCCGALVHHMGREADALDAARANVDAWWRLHEAGGLDAIVITASGCGTTVKDYGFMLRHDPAYAQKAATIAALAKDVTEVLTGLELGAPVRRTEAAVAYHSACSMQHGQKIRREPKTLLQAAGFTVKDVPEGHLCCGSAGTYNIMQPGIAVQLRDRKLANIDTTGAAIVATGNIGCMTQLGAGTRPVVHTVELIDWAYGGPAPAAAAGLLEPEPAAA
ncbi:heterodisulfide reductase-related iron-sulfur binding cluster [Acuticoccus mangrovi]|uniref:Glycolate oxidase iron-sulfur subunit n=1 Tax=Acuticoccus mangrovi TaxID=2796142 RepID=A0A934IR93_9HYPH|nr:heterodisulfide reductase-related iron-sulfur binding cluster [Acuticoccus mangrovi]MBJ3776184.1 4Fe-4S dicluster domain-containing protein [Acuticoccus mangrovi]